MNDMTWCASCRSYGSEDHICTVYDGPVCATPGCGEPTVFVHLSAPGSGRGYACRNGHYHGTRRILTAAEVR